MSHRRRKVLFAAKQSPRFFQLQELSAQPDLLEHPGCECGEVRFESALEALGGGDGLRVDDQLFQAVTGEGVEHARTRNHVDSRQRSQRSRGGAFHAGLGVDPLGLGRHHVAVGR